MKRFRYGFASLALALPITAAADVQEFGPWKIGMSRDEVLSVSQYGKYERHQQGPAGESLRTASKVEFMGYRSSVRLILRDGKVLNIHIEIPQTERESKAAEAVKTGVNYLRSKVGLPDEDIDTAELAKRLSAYAQTYVHRIPGHSNLTVQVSVRLASASSQDFLFSGQVNILGVRSAPSAPQPGNDSEPGESETVLSDWTMRVPGGDSKFKRNLASIHALLVKPIGNGGNAAQAMKLSATAVPGLGSQVKFSFNQPVGSDMSRASEEVVRAIQVKHGGLPGGMDVEFGFADKWGGKDGPSAAVATALLIESLLGGFEIPTSLAVTGDLNADQSVQPVGGVADKIRGAMAKDCTWIGVPAANEEDLNDLVVEENLRRFLTAKVFTLKKLDDAVVLANVGGRDPEFTQSMAAFDAIQKDLATGGASALYSKQMKTRLGAVVAAVPNFYSAKVLLAASQKKAPARYSLAGTLVRIDEAMAPYGETIAELRAGESVEKFRFGRNNPISEARNRLNDLKQKSDPRLIGVITAQQLVIDRTLTLINAKTKSSTVFEKLVSELGIAHDRADAQWKQIIDNQQIQDQLMKRGIHLE